MPPLHQALSRLQLIMKERRTHVLHTSDFSRQDREILVRQRWLEEIIRGWYLAIRPDVMRGDSTAWYANFWDFLRVYLEHHYGQHYCLSAKCSLDIHVGNSVVPKQVVVMAAGGSGIPLSLPYGTSLLVYADPARLPEDRQEVNGLQIMPLAHALCRVAPIYFQASPSDAEIALRSISSSGELVQVISQHGYRSAAGRLAGALRFLGKNRMADDLVADLLEVGIVVVETNPFEVAAPLLVSSRYRSPYANRICALWENYRQVVLTHFPKAPGKPKDGKVYLEHIAEVYVQDAYNSLSIEGYQVSEELIEKVKLARWNPDGDQSDRQQRDALAARGYYEAFQVVKKTVERILKDDTPGEQVEEDLPRWFQRLFAPSVQMGIVSASDLSGYRRDQVYIRHSRHTPPPKEALPDSMDAFFSCLKQEESAAVRAVLGHFVFVYIHPYMDGNGRIGRFLMNAMLASGGYPWTVIRVVNRARYLEALESASVGGDIVPLTQFIASEMLPFKG